MLDRRRRRTRPLVAGALGLLSVLGGCSGDDGEATGATGDPLAAGVVTSAATTTSVVIAGDPVNRHTLVVGDCFTTYVVETETITARQPCATPHLQEVFAAHVHPARFGEAWPGDEALQKYALRLCYADFAAFVGVIYELSELSIGAIVPPQANWEDTKARYRGILCFLGRADGKPLTASMRGAKL